MNFNLMSILIFETNRDLAFSNVILENGNKLSYILVERYDIEINQDAHGLEDILNEIFNDNLNIVHVLYSSNLPGNIKHDELADLWNKNHKPKFGHLMRVSLHKGQTDTTANTLQSLIKDICKYKLEINDIEVKVHTSKTYYYNIDNYNDNIFEQLKLLWRVNPIIHLVQSSCEHNDICKKIDTVEHKIINEQYEISSMNEVQLIGLSNNLQLGLSLDDMVLIQKHYNARKITRLELETFAQTWSEHCKHRIFCAHIDDIEGGLYKTYIKGATEKIRERRISSGQKDICYSVFSDNAGAIEFNDDYLITHKVETHNSPSALDPFGGAITGILGVNRDCLGFGLGAKPVMNTYAFCFTNDKKSKYYRGKDFTNPLLDTDYIISGVINGIEAGGNCSGIPTVHGVTYFHESYIAKPLVFAGTIGLIPKTINGRQSWVKEPMDGDLIIILGGATGRDGIHGAIFSSAELDCDGDITHVQIGEPIVQKKVLDAIMEMRDNSLFNAITDNGAGGFSSSIGELGCHGFIVNLDKARLKSGHMQPYEIWVSESQERMTLAVPAQNMALLIQICQKHNVDYVELGIFNKSGKGLIQFSDELGKVGQVSLDLDFLHNGAGQYKLKSEKPIIDNNSASCLKQNRGILNLKEHILKLMSSANVASKAYIANKYDHSVQGGMIFAPIENGVCTNVSVYKPILQSKGAVAATSCLLPSYGSTGISEFEDTYNMVMCQIDFCVRACIASGCAPDHIALLDNFCWSDPFNPKRLWQLKRAAEACYDGAIMYDAPYISGKDSMFNNFSGFDHTGNSVCKNDIPTVLISAIGIMQDSDRAINMGFKKAGDLIYILGNTFNEMGGSQYNIINNINDGVVPSIRNEGHYQQYGLFSKLIIAENNIDKCCFIKSVYALERGGLASAIVLNALHGGLGANIELSDMSEPDAMNDPIIFLFSESAGRILFTIDPSNKDKLDRFIKEHSLSAYFLGDVSSEAKISFMNPDFEIDLDDLKHAYMGE